MYIKGFKSVGLTNLCNIYQLYRVISFRFIEFSSRTKLLQREFIDKQMKKLTPTQWRSHHNT